MRVSRARELRRSSTDAERKLWHRLRDHRLAGHKFRRQHPIGSFFADFVCIEAGLIVELDGGQHFEPESTRRDAARTAALGAAGFEVIRFDDRQVLIETQAVLEVILARLGERCPRHRPHPGPLPLAGEGANANPFPLAGEGANPDPFPLAREGANPDPFPLAGEVVTNETSKDTK